MATRPAKNLLSRFENHTLVVGHAEGVEGGGPCAPRSEAPVSGRVGALVGEVGMNLGFSDRRIFSKIRGGRMRLLIDGRLTEGERTFPSRNPATGEVVGRAPDV
ncbi:hypothetical protein E1200_01165 [Actinomadura sp. GC306]|nr:hypothetical protein E1200_01165 [Actinomadura sp. GC306]